MNDITFEELQDLIFKWNIDFPIDRWWRKSHSVAFNSKNHREMSFIDMFIEWQEELLYEQLSKEDRPYIRGSGNYIKVHETDNTLPEDFLETINFDDL